MTTIKTTIGCLFGFLLAAGCGGGGNDYDTVGDAFVAISEAACDRAIECGFRPAAQRDACESEAVGGVCAEIDCAAEFDGDSADVDACVDALDDFSCDTLGQGTLPSRCLSL